MTNFLIQPCALYGAGVVSSWRRCGKRVGTCATAAHRLTFRGAGPQGKITPAPKMGHACAIINSHLRQRWGQSVAWRLEVFIRTIQILQPVVEKDFVAAGADVVAGAAAGDGLFDGRPL